MSRCRLVFALCALSAVFVLPPAAPAMPGALVNQFLGGNMIRAEALIQTPAGVQDWRIDRGVITAVSGTSLTLAERDGTSVTLAVSPTARVDGPPRFSTLSALRPQLRVVLYRQGDAPAELVQVERGNVAKEIAAQYFGATMIRAEVLVQGAGGVQDWRIDRGVITAISRKGVTLRERDGTVLTLQVDRNARVQGSPRFSSVSLLRRRLRIVLYRQGDAPAQLVQVEGASG